MSDPIADMLTRIRNAAAVKKPEVSVPYSKLKASLANLLKSQGWLKEVEVVEGVNPKKFLRLVLKYQTTGESVFTGLRRVSRSGQRIYAKYTEIPRLGVGAGLTIISTSKGLMTCKQARKEKIGGEIICQIW